MNNISIYECRDGRYRVYLKDEKRVISYPKYLMEKKLGRKLNRNEQVHHKDGNPLNNDIDNLEIKLLGSHQKEHSTKYFDKEVNCPWCNKLFLWTAKQQARFYDNKKRKGISVDNAFCSRKCAGEYSVYSK